MNCKDWVDWLDLFDWFDWFGFRDSRDCVDWGFEKSHLVSHLVTAWKQKMLAHLKTRKQKFILAAVLSANIFQIFSSLFSSENIGKIFGIIFLQSWTQSAVAAKFTKNQLQLKQSVFNSYPNIVQKLNCAGGTFQKKFVWNKGIGDAGSTADLRMLWSAIVCLGLGLL